MTYPKTKFEITKAILSEMPHTLWHEIPIDEVMSRWWMTGRMSSAMRLNDEGAAAFNQANIEFYQFPLGLSKDKKITKPEQFILELSKKIHCPYYIGVNKEKKEPPYIRIYDHKIATMMTLYGTLRDYLDSLDNRI